MPGLTLEVGPGRASVFVLLVSLLLAACGTSHPANVSQNAQVAARTCRAHLADVGAGATFVSAVGESAQEAAATIRANGADPTPWDRVAADDVVAECQYRFPPGPQNPVVRCGPDLVQPSTRPTTLYFFDGAGRHSRVHLRAQPGATTQCSGPAQPVTTTT